MNGPAPKRMDLKAWTQELRSSRRTQVALVVLVLVSTYLLWPEPPRRKPLGAAPGRLVTAVSERDLEPLQKLRDLTAFDQAGELPKEGRMYRDLFLFDLPSPPPPPPPKPLPPPPPPPPPTPEELAAAQLAQARQDATNSRPQALRYLGYMGRASTGRIGTFAKGEEILSLRPGDQAAPGWKLVALSEAYAEFQNDRFPDLRYRAEAKDRQATAAAGAGATNQF
jgi:type IV secretory pathway VirB10-like protein